MFKPVIIDDFLNKTYFDYLDSYLHSYACEWKFNRNISTGPLAQEGHEPWKIGCAKGMFDASKQMGFDATKTEFFLPLCLITADHFKLNGGSCIRCRADMTVMSNGVRHNPHVDVGAPHWTAILYFSDTDGDTIIYNERYGQESRMRQNLESDEDLTILETITPKKNRLVFFDGWHFHTGHSPTTSPNRILLNMNFAK